MPLNDNNMVNSGNAPFLRLSMATPASTKPATITAISKPSEE